MFLDGCSTRPQVQLLLDAGVRAVIATARPIDDRAACDVAVAFYEALTAGGEAVPAGGRSLRAVFDAACGMSLVRYPKTAPTATCSPFTSHRRLKISPAGMACPGTCSSALGPSRSNAGISSNAPLFGLPDLPDDIGWPNEPYNNLEYFQREHARIFFGRGRPIRELFNLLTLPAGAAESRLIFYYGQTGVGKTSVLAAGLLPRVETLFVTRYCQRSAQDGLLGALTSCAEV